MYTKIDGPKSRDKKVISFKALAYREAICNHMVGAIYNWEGSLNHWKISSYDNEGQL